jgi:hypothetical protein
MSALDPLPRLREHDQQVIDVGKALEELSATPGYQAWLDAAFKRFFDEVRIACGALSGDEALISTARMRQILEMIDGMGAGRDLGKQVEEDFRQRYEEAARRQLEAGRRSERGGMRAGRSSAPTL